MSRVRRAYVVYVDLDPMPGEMGSQESAHNVIRRSLQRLLPYYNVVVSLAPADLQPGSPNEI